MVYIDCEMYKQDADIVSPLDDGSIICSNKCPYGKKKPLNLHSRKGVEIGICSTRGKITIEEKIKKGNLSPEDLFGNEGHF